MSSRKSERLLNLVVMLMKSERFVTRREIQRQVPDYAAAPSQDAFERMFERDKAELRDLGVILRTGPEGVVGDDAGYRIIADDVALPATTFTPEELTILALAARAWDQAAWASAAQAGRLKLSAYAEGEPDVLTDVILRVATPDDAYSPFLSAITQRRPVTFDYRASSAAASVTRRIEPWVLSSTGGAWYVIGHDLDRQAPRSFRLSRVRGDVRTDLTATPFEPPAREQIRSALALLDPEDPTLRSSNNVLSATPGRGHALRRIGRLLGADPRRDGNDLIEVTTMSDRLLVQQLATVAPDVVPVAPEQQQQLRDHLEAVLASVDNEVTP